MISITTFSAIVGIKIARFEVMIVIAHVLYTTGAIARTQAYFGIGSGPIFLDNVGCVGTESRLINCSANPIGSNNCFHNEDAGVTCQSELCSMQE